LVMCGEYLSEFLAGAAPKRSRLPARKNIPPVGCPVDNLRGSPEGKLITAYEWLYL